MSDIYVDGKKEGERWKERDGLAENVLKLSRQFNCSAIHFFQPTHSVKYISNLE